MAIRGLKLIAASIISAFLCAGCLSVENEIEVFPDGSGRLSSTLEFDARAYVNLLQRSIEEEFQQEQEFIGEDFQQPDPDISQRTVCLGGLIATGSLPDRVVSKDSDQELSGFSGEAIYTGGKCSVTETLEWTAGEFPEVARILAEEGTRIMKLDSGNWRLEVADLRQDPILEMTADPEFGLEMEEISEMWEEMAGLVFDVTVSVAITLPGEPVDHNAHAVEGSRFSWSFDLAEIMEGAEVRLYAETNPEGDGGLGVGAILAIILLGILGLAIVLAIGFRQQRARSLKRSQVESGGNAEVESEDAEVVESEDKFDGAEVESEVKFDGAEVESEVKFDGAEVESEVKFDNAEVESEDTSKDSEGGG